MSTPSEFCRIDEVGSEFLDHPKPLPLDPTTQKTIRFVAKRFLRIYSWYPDSLEDVEQECWLTLWTQIDHFDPERASWGTFVRQVAVSHCRDLRKFHRRKKRRAMNRVWLEDPVPPGDDGEELSVEEVLREDAHHHRFGCRFLTQYDQADLQDAIDWLPAEDLGRLAMLLQVNKYREIQETLGLTRSQLRNGLTELGIRLRQAGIEPSSLLA